MPRAGAPDAPIAHAAAGRTDRHPEPSANSGGHALGLGRGRASRGSQVVLLSADQRQPDRVEAEHDSRIAAGVLNNPIIYDRFANGIAVNQLVTDFGRTHELVKSSNLHAKAQQENVTATRADVLLRVNQAYFAVLKAQAVLQVAEQTVKSRQLVADQISALQKNNLKSGLDVSFANVDLAQAQLLLIQAQNDVQSSFADLSTALGYSDQRMFALADQPPQPSPPADFAPLVQEALQNRPELIGQDFNVKSAQSYATAERDLWLPTISAVGVAGLIPFRQDTLASRYAAAGFNVNIPIFNGRLFTARRMKQPRVPMPSSSFCATCKTGLCATCAPLG